MTEAVPLCLPDIMEQTKPSKPDASAENGVKAPNILERAKEEIEAIMHPQEESPHNDSQRNDPPSEDIAPLNEIKAPNIIERAKEEVEALIETVKSKKESNDNTSSQREGFWGFLGRRFENFCSPCSPSDRKKR